MTRNEKIKKAVKNGQTKTSQAKKYGLSEPRIWQIVNAYNRRKKKQVLVSEPVFVAQQFTLSDRVGHLEKIAEELNSALGAIRKVTG